MQFWQSTEVGYCHLEANRPQVVAVFASLWGRFLAMLAITRLVSMISAATAKRTLAIIRVGEMPVVS